MAELEENQKLDKTQNGDTQVVTLPLETLKKAVESGTPISIEVRSVSMAHAGPLPPPAILAGYDDVSPGLSSIIVEEFRLETKNRRRLQWVGQIGSFAIVSVALLVGAYVAISTEDWLRALAITGPICGLVGINQFVQFWVKLRQ